MDYSKKKTATRYSSPELVEIYLRPLKEKPSSQRLYHKKTPSFRLAL
nr:MAG TPA: hypothetical protein [Caudoviricetes sp.]